MISVKEFKERRNNLYQKLEDNSVLILYSGHAKKRSADEDFEFFANRNFLYLTNIEQEDSILLVTKNNDVIGEYLFIAQHDANIEKWTGKRLTSEEASKASGINNILYLNTFYAQLGMILDRKEHLYGIFDNLYLDMEEENKIDSYNSSPKDIKERLALNYEYLNFIDVYGYITDLRAIKSVQEVEEFKEAVSKTNIGLNSILKNLYPGKYEYQLSSLFFYTIQDLDYSPLSFPTICATGKNATIMHYPTPLSKIDDGDLVLFDLGCKSNGYCADISRTYPANGKFSELQRKIYSIVLECNKLIIKTVKPGLTLSDLQNTAKSYLAKRCFEEGLIKTLEDIDSVYCHSVTHFIGLDTHDPSNRLVPLMSGNIISDEPGLYFEELGIGVRIEDDILVTEDGCYCLSGNIIKEINDIEKAMLFRE